MYTMRDLARGKPFLADLTHGYQYTLSQDIQPNQWYILSTDYTGEWQGLWIDNMYVGYFSEGKITFKSPVEISVDSDIVIKVDDAESLITWAKLERGTKATDWSPAPEDIDLAIRTVDTKVDDKVREINVNLNGITTRVSDTETSILDIEDGKADRVDVENVWTNLTSAQTSIIQLADELSLKANSTEITSLSETMSSLETSIALNTDAITLKADQEYVDNISGIVDNHSAELAILSDNITLEFSRLSSELDETTGSLGEIKSYFDFRESGLNIGKSDSPLNINISNEQMDFIDKGQVVAYINGQKMYIDSLEVLSSMVVGVHKIEKYDTDITFVRWIGDEING